MPSIGIDLGTTNSCVGVYKNGRVEIAANDLGNRVTPSVVSFTEDELLVGDTAKEEVSSNVKNTLFQIKRLIGRSYDDPIVQNDKKLWGFDVINNNNKPTISVKYKGQLKTFCQEEISAMVLASLKKTAEDFLGEPVTDAVITVPAYFNDAQRSATRDAGKIAGLNVVRMINEPTAAALAHGLGNESKEEQNVLIFDLGGGTFDVTVLTLKNRTFVVQATGGDTHLGGDDFDNRMVEHFVEEFNRKNKSNTLSENKRGLNRLRVACEAAKRKLTASTDAKVQIDALHDGKDFTSNITRAKFEEINYDFFSKTIETVKEVLAGAKIEKVDVDSIVLVGGSTRILKIRELLSNFFDGKGVSKIVNPDEVVADGATALAAKLSNRDDIEEFTLNDVAALSLGWESGGCDMVRVVQRNTKIPTEKFGNAITSKDDQTTVVLKVYEGERAATKDNMFLGSFEINDIPPARRGKENISICFSIDESGILTVSARNVSSGKSSQISFPNDRGRLSAARISSLISKAENLRKEDAAWRERSKARNALENYVYSVKHKTEDTRKEGNVAQEDAELLLDKCKDILNWIVHIGNPRKEDSEAKKKELEKLSRPFLNINI